MKFVLDEGAYIPKREHGTDAGIDIRSREAKTVKAGGCAVFRTGIHVEIPVGCAGIIVSKSGLNVMHDITSTGLIDEGYTGEIVVKLYNSGEKDHKIYAGDKISQLVVVPVRYESIEIVAEIKAGERGNNGFGSTGR